MSTPVKLTVSGTLYGMPVDETLSPRSGMDASKTSWVGGDDEVFMGQADFQQIERQTAAIAADRSRSGKLSKKEGGGSKFARLADRVQGKTTLVQLQADYREFGNTVHVVPEDSNSNFSALYHHENYGNNFQYIKVQTQKSEFSAVPRQDSAAKVWAWLGEQPQCDEAMLTSTTPPSPPPLEVRNRAGTDARQRKESATPRVVVTSRVGTY